MEAFIYFAFGIIASILINLATPYIQKKLEQSRFINIGRRLHALEEERTLITELHSNSSKMVATAIRDLIIIVGIFAAEVILIGTAVSLQALAYRLPQFRQVIFFGDIITRLA